MAIEEAKSKMERHKTVDFEHLKQLKVDWRNKMDEA